METQDTDAIDTRIIDQVSDYLDSIAYNPIEQSSSESESSASNEENA